MGGGTATNPPQQQQQPPALGVHGSPAKWGQPQRGDPQFGGPWGAAPPKLTVLPPPSTCSPGGQWQCEDNACLVDGDLIDAINGGNYG